MWKKIKHFMLKLWLKLKGWFKKTNFDNVIFQHFIDNVFKPKIKKFLQDGNLDKLDQYISKIKKFELLDKLSFNFEVSKLKDSKNIEAFCNWLITEYNKNL